jgi:hypothetical protein
MRSLFAAILLLLTSAIDGEAQSKGTAGNLITINGVVKTKDGEPLQAAEVIAGEIRAITNDSGSFTLRNVPGGSVFLVVRRIGYVPGTLSFDTEPALREVTLEARLVPSAVTLGTVVIEGKTMDRQLWQSGYYKRKTLGDGVFFDPERMRHTAASLSTIMQEVPQVQIQTARGGARIPMGKRGAGIGGQILCPLNVFLDGHYIPWASQVGIDDVIAQQDIKAIEVYPRRIPSSLRAPGGSVSVGSGFTIAGIEMASANIECGAILLWSKTVEEARADAKRNQ